MGLSVGTERPTGRWLLPAATVAAVLYAWFIYHCRFEVDGRPGFSLFDDAMISMRYAQNLAHGDGLRWNVGRAPVEGYTNFLWTLWMAFLQLFPLSQESVSLGVSVTSAALLLANLWLVRRLVLYAGGSEWGAVFAVSFVALSYPLVFWSLRGLEVGVLAFLVDASILLAFRAEEASSTRERWALAAALVAMVLVRDDALVAVLVIVTFLAADPRTRGVARLSGLGVMVALLAHLSFRLAYYGFPLPNTYYLKLAGIPLTVRLARGGVAIARTSVAELLLPLVLVCFARIEQSGQRRVRMLVAVVLGQLVAAVVVGGDAWESWGQPDRFVSIALPALIVASALGAEALRRRPEGPYAIAFALALVFRAVAVAMGDFVPRSFTVTPPVDLHGGLRGLAHWGGGFLAGALVVAALALAARRSRSAPAWWSAGVMGVVVVATVGPNWRDFLRGEATAQQIRWDGRNAVFGIRLGQAVPRNTTIAVVAAGAIPFFSNLEAVDLLGKNDAHVAHEPPVERFVPGHDKRDYVYSLATYEPDVVLELWHHSPEELRAVGALGYRQLSNGMYVRGETNVELADILEHRLPEYPFTTHRPVARERGAEALFSAPHY